MGAVIPMRPVRNALDQLQRLGAADNLRRECVRCVLTELREGRSGNAVAGEIQRQRLHAPTPTTGGAA